MKKVVAGFGEEALTEEGEMNREYIGQQIFYDDLKREKLNAIIHPIVREIMENEKKQYLAQGHDVVMDIPLLFEMD